MQAKNECAMKNVVERNGSLCRVCMTSDPAEHDPDDPFLDANGLCLECADLQVPRRESQRHAWRCPDCHRKQVRIITSVSTMTPSKNLPREHWHVLDVRYGERYVCLACGWWASTTSAGQSAVGRARLAVENLSF